MPAGLRFEGCERVMHAPTFARRPGSVQGVPRPALTEGSARS